MGFVCDDCKRPVRQKSRACRHCGRESTVEAWFASAFLKLGAKSNEPVCVVCPVCSKELPASKVQCPGCDADFVAGPGQSQGAQPTGASADGVNQRAKRRIQWAYCLVSLGVVWAVFEYARNHHSAGWISRSVLSVFFLSISLFLLAKLVPREVLRSFFSRAPLPTKLALGCNYFTALLLIEIAVGVWWSNALMLAGLVLVTWAGLVLFSRSMNRWSQITGQFLGEDDRGTFDPSKHQGRQGRHD